LLESAPNHFEVDNVQEEYERLVKLGVKFSMAPRDVATVKTAIFHDTCGNNIQIVEML
jgi:predicted enzyme related to lactoylglutathione lyase